MSRHALGHRQVEILRVALERGYCTTRMILSDVWGQEPSRSDRVVAAQAAERLAGRDLLRKIGTAAWTATGAAADELRRADRRRRRVRRCGIPRDSDKRITGFMVKVGGEASVADVLYAIYHWPVPDADRARRKFDPSALGPRYSRERLQVHKALVRLQRLGLVEKIGPARYRLVS